MKENAEIIISIIGALGIRELLSYGLKWYRENNDTAKDRKREKQEQIDKEIEMLRTKIEVIQMQLNQTQQRNVKLETAINLSLQFIERTSPENKPMIEDIRALLK